MGKNLHSFLPIRYPRYAIRILTYGTLCNKIYIFHCYFFIIIDLKYTK